MMTKPLNVTRPAGKYMGNLIKILLALLVCTALGFSSAQAQDRTVSLSSHEISIRDALREIETQTGYRFALGHSNFDMSRIVTLTDSNDTVRSILGQLLKESNRTYRMGSDGQILIIPVHVEPQEENKMVVVRFDWSRSYGDADFIRDLEEMREASAKQVLPERLPETITEVTLVPDSVFHYSPRVLTHDLNSGDWWRMDNDAPNHVAIKTTVLYGAVALAANLSAEIGVGSKTSFELAYGMNNWNKYNDDNRKKIHWYVRPEFRYWTCNRFEGHFFGVHGFYWQYNVSRYHVPGMFEREFQYEGNALGLGLTYGYSLPLSKNWGVEFSAGLGLAFMKYDKYECARCGDIIGNYNKTYFGLTGLAVKIVYLIK